MTTLWGNLKSNLILWLILTCLPITVNGQIFQETFDEVNGSTTGTENIAGIPWTTSCPTCSGSWDVDANELVANNTDGEAVWETTSPLDISSCNYIEITIDIEADGDFEDCGGGCNATDWVKLEYNLDATGFQTPSNAYTCNNGCPTTDVIFSTATETGESITYSSQCMNGGNDLLLRITALNWAGGEYWRIDNITVSCATGPNVGAGSDQSVCSGQQVTLTASNPDGAAISWNNGVTDGVPFTPSSTDYYVVTGVLGNCSAQDSALVTVNPGPSFNLSSTDATSCNAPYDGTITISGLSPGSSYDVTYDDGNVVGPTSYTANASGEIVLTGLAPGSYTNFQVDSSGCSTLDASIIDISSPGSPTVSAGNDTTICEGSSITLTANNPDGASIAWDNGITDGVAFTPSVGTTTYTVTADLSGCTSTDAVDITVIAATTVTVNNAGPFSVNSGVQTLSASPSGGTWTSNCGGCINSSTGEFDPTTAGVGNWEVCYEAGTAPCEDSACIIIEVVNGCALSGNVYGSSPSCYGYSDGSVGISVSGANGSVNYIITDSTGNQVNSNGSNIANLLSSGWYYFEITDNASCTYIDSIELDNPLPITADVFIEDTLCYGVNEGYMYVDTVYDYAGHYDSLYYSWNPSPTGSNGIGKDTLYNLTPNDYVLTINDVNGCTEEINLTVTYPDELEFDTLDSRPSFCRLSANQSGGGVVFASANGGTPGYTYNWLYLKDSSSTINSTWGSRNPGEYQITITDANGCTLTETILLDSVNPMADFIMNSTDFTAEWEGTSPVSVNFVNNSVYFSDPNNPNADTTFFWDIGFDNYELTHNYYKEYDTTYTEGGTYTVCLIAQNHNGCEDEKCIDIVVYDPLKFTPINVFTPNGDGLNDVFTFYDKSIAVDEFKCTIVNRWGRIVAELNSISDSWDGTHISSGNSCTEGVYFYTYSGAAENGDKFKGQGTVQLIDKK